MKRTLCFMIMIFMSILAVTPAFAYIFAGTGTSGDPYQIGSMADLMEAGSNSATWASYFIQTADIEAGGEEFTHISPASWGTAFTGNYDGKNKTISNLYITQSGVDNIGFIGKTVGATISNLNLVNVSIVGGLHTGGLIGKAINTQVINCSLTGTVNGTQYVGGLVGCSENSVVSNSHVDASITGTGTNVGGLIGCASQSSSITNCYVTGSVTGSSTSTGGLLGNISASSITNSYASASVTGGEANSTGGLVGSVVNNSTIANSYATGNVTGPNAQIGGLVGTLTSSSLNNCYATGNIASTGGTIGGLVGSSASSTIENCFATGTATNGWGTIGGLVATRTGGSVTNSFWDKENSGLTSSPGGGVGKTTAEMQDGTTFTGATWDFDGETPNGTLEIWKIDPLLNNGYPYLTWAEAYDDTLPVTLTSFMVIQNAQNFATINWTTESESSLTGYNIYRNEIQNQDTAIRMNSNLIGATNSSLGSSYSFVDEKVEANTTYYYWLQVNEFDGSANFHGPYKIRIDADYNGEVVVIPTKTTLRNVYPNPFNPSTSVSFYMDKAENVKLNVYNMKGQLVTNLTQDNFAEGFHNVVWNGQDARGQDCASGIYFFRMESAHSTQMIKGILMK